MTGSSSRSWRREAPPNHSMAEGVGPETSLVIIGAAGPSLPSFLDVSRSFARQMRDEPSVRFDTERSPPILRTRASG